MKILLLDVNCKYSSTGKIVYDLHQEFTKSGHEATLSYGRGPKIIEPGISMHATKLSVYVHVLLTRIFGFVGYGNFMTTKRFMKSISKLSPDIIHLHTLHGYHLNMYALLNYIKKNNIPTVLTLHDTTVFTGKCGHTYACDKWKTQCEKCPQLLEYPKSLFFDRSKHEFNIKKKYFSDSNNILITSVSNWLKSKAESSAILDRKPIITVHNGLDTSLFYPREKLRIEVSSLKRKHLNLLFVTPNFTDSSKGGQYVVQLARHLRPLDIKIFVVGANEGTENMESVEYLGIVHNQELLAEYYSFADYLLMLSKLETFSMVTIESLACGTPVIGFDALGPTEIANSDFGLFVENGNINALAEEIKLLYKGEKTLASKERCYQHVIDNFSKTKMASQYLEAYKQVITVVKEKNHERRN